MATDKKHIAVYLDPAVEAALVAFCEQKGLKSKKGTMFSAGVNAALAEFFGIAGTEVSNIPKAESSILGSLDGNIPTESNIPTTEVSNIPKAESNIPTTEVSNIPKAESNIPVKMTSNISAATASNIPSATVVMEELPGKFRA